MATVIIGYTWTSGDNVTITIDVDESYPDALDQASAQAIRALREAIVVLTDATTEDTPDG